MTYQVVTRTSVDQREASLFTVTTRQPIEVGATLYAKDRQWVVGEVRDGDPPRLFCVPWYFDLVRMIDVAPID